MRRVIAGMLKRIIVYIVTSITNHINYRWNRGVVGADGNVYMIPLYCPQVIKFDFTNKIESVLSGYNNSAIDKYQNGCLAQNGNIYAAPSNEKRILEINTNTQSVQLVGNTLSIGNFAYYSTILAPNGNIYMPPFSSNFVLKFNPITKSTSFFGTGIASGNDKCIRSVGLANGMIYCFPYNASNLLIINTNDDTVTQTAWTGVKQIRGVQLAPNGKIYFKNNTSAMYEFNPANLSIKQVTNVLPESANLFLGIDGLIYSFSSDSRLMSFNPNTYEIIYYNLSKNLFSYGATINGNLVYCFAFYSQNVNYYLNLPTMENVLGDDAFPPSDLNQLPTSNYNLYFNNK